MHHDEYAPLRNRREERARLRRKRLARRTRYQVPAEALRALQESAERRY